MEITWQVGKEIIAVSGVTRQMGRLFKDTFPSGRWSPAANEWQIIRSSVALEKLEQFRSRAQRANIASARLAETELAYQELQRLEGAIETMEAQIERAFANQDALEALNETYEKLFSQHQDVSGSLRNAVKQANELTLKNKKSLEPIFEALNIHSVISEIVDARGLKKNASNLDKYDTARFQLKLCHSLITDTISLDIQCLLDLAELDWDAAEITSPKSVIMPLYTKIREAKPIIIH
jgi:pyruvate formate-lyase activating enzyme-like uncharacterized protein